ncbi:MAG: phage holin family protein [Dehalococcoidia bacterium]
MREVFYYQYQPPPGPTAGGLLVRFALNAVGLFLASVLVPGVHVGDWQSLVAGTAIFAIVNMLLRPLAIFLSCCLVALSFGLFVLVVNALMLGVAAWAAARLGLDFRVDGFWAALFGALVISAVSLVGQLVTGAARVGKR